MDRPKLVQPTATGWHSPLGEGETGSSEPHRFHTDHGVYLVKARNNPQGQRVLANQLVGGLCLDWLGVHHPAPAIVSIPEAVIEESPGARFSNGQPLQPGLAFGSEH